MFLLQLFTCLGIVIAIDWALVSTIKLFFPYE